MTRWQMRHLPPPRRSRIITARNTHRTASGFMPLAVRFRSPCLALHQRDRNGVQVVEGTRFNDRPVAASVFVFTGEAIQSAHASHAHVI